MNQDQLTTMRDIFSKEELTHINTILSLYSSLILTHHAMKPNNASPFLTHTFNSLKNIQTIFQASIEYNNTISLQLSVSVNDLPNVIITLLMANREFYAYTKRIHTNKSNNCKQSILSHRRGDSR